MKRVMVFTSIMLSLMSAHGVRATDAKPLQHHKKIGATAEDKHVVSIHVAEGDWGNAKPDEIEALLTVVSERLLVHFPGRTLNPIIVSPSQHGPVVLYQKGPANEYQVRLSAKDRRWAEYVYEFSHELMHILANYEYHAPLRGAGHQWFEEMLCETASLYILKQLSLNWEQSAPRPEWISYGKTLSEFTTRALTDRHRQLPPNKSFTQWFQENGLSLTGNPYLREKNELVANLFLPLLEQRSDWSAIAYLNTDAARKEASFYSHLADWYKNTPVQHRKFVADAMRLFRFNQPDISDTPAVARSPHTLPVISPGDADAGAAGGTRRH